MLHPALARALATAHIEDQLHAAARWHTIRLARRAARESQTCVAMKLRGVPIQSGHDQAEQAPDELAQAIREFLANPTP